MTLNDGLGSRAIESLDRLVENLMKSLIRGLPFSTSAARRAGGGGGGGSSLLYIFIAYYMQKGGGGLDSM